MSKPRSKKTRSLPENLYERDGYFSYRHPITKKEKGWGRNKQAAIKAAITLNEKFRQPEEAKLVASVLNDSKTTISAASDLFEREMIINHPKLAASTKKEKVYRLNRIRKDLGQMDVKTFRTVDAANWLSGIKGDAYRQHRTVLSQLMDYCQTIGWVDTNVVTPTQSSDLNYKKSRQRLTLEQFKAIRMHAEPWLQVAMNLALLTCQGRNEIVSMRFDHIKDNVLYVVRKKTETKTVSAYIAISITPALQQVIDFAQTLPPASPRIVHRRPERLKPETRHGDWGIDVRYLSKAFQKTRDKVSSISALPEEQRPSFHEIRSLGAYLLEREHGIKKTQALLGHAKEDMTKVYLEGHEQKWIAAEAANFSI